MNAYYRLYESRLKLEIAEDFKKQTETTNPTAHRNHFLATKLKAESEEVKENVEKNRVLPGT